MKKKFLTRKSYLLYLFVWVCFGIILWTIMHIFVFRYFAYKFQIFTIIGFVSIYILLGPVYLIRGSATIIFESKNIVYKENIFSKSRIYLYTDMTKIELYYKLYSNGRISSNPAILVYFKNKKAAFMIEIEYDIVYLLIKNKPRFCKVKVEDFGPLRIFSEKHRELLYEYLTTKQKKELERLLEKKNRRKRKKTA